MPQAMLIMSVVSAVASYAQGQAQAKSASKAANAQSKANWENYYVQKNQLEQEAQQQSNQAMVESSERSKQLLAEQSRITTLAGESGIAGGSVDALLQDSYMQAGIDISTIESNRLNRSIQNNSQSNSSYAVAKEGNRRANQAAQDAYNSAPSLLSTGLAIGSSVAGYKDKYGSLTSSTPVKK